jgi:uncharacterized protein involved in outer membrane biogenesis
MGIGVAWTKPNADGRLWTNMKLIVLVIALFVAAFFGTQVFLNHTIEQGIETIAPELTGTAVELGEVDLSLLSGKGSIRGLVVGNPKGFHTDNAFELEEVRVDLALLSVLSGTVVVEEIYIAAPKITFEKKGDTSNLLAIAKHVHSAVGGSGSEDEAPDDEESDGSKGPTVRINRFKLTDAEISAQIFKDKTLDVPLPGIELTNLGGERGASIGEVSAEVMDTVTGRVVAAVTKRMMSFGAGGGTDETKSADEAEATDETKAEGQAEAEPTRRERRARKREDAE